MPGIPKSSTKGSRPRRVFPPSKQPQPSRVQRTRSHQHSSPYRTRLTERLQRLPAQPQDQHDLRPGSDSDIEMGSQSGPDVEMEPMNGAQQAGWRSKRRKMPSQSSHANDDVDTPPVIDMNTPLSLSSDSDSRCAQQPRNPAPVFQFQQPPWSPPPLTSIRLAIQLQPNNTPLPVELLVTYDEDSASMPHVQLYSDEATPHANSLKRTCNSDNAFTERQSKRQCRGPLSSSTHKNMSPLKHQSETHTSRARSSYVVDLGIVRAFATADDRVPLPASPDPDNLTSSNTISLKRPLHDFEPLVFKAELPRSNRRLTRDGRHECLGSDASLDFSEVTCSPGASFLAKTFGLAIVLFLVLSLVLMPIHYHLDRSSPLPSASSSQFVSWFEDAATIEISKMTIPRIVLFGEVFDEEPRWKCQPGLRPEYGRDDHSGSNRSCNILMPEDPLNSSFHFDHKPWETTSSGTYVPVLWFLTDLITVMQTTVADLTHLANHGPSAFLFTSDSSTQFRWSTSDGTFIPPHRSLPTFTFNMADSKSPGPTVPGLTTPAHQSPTPTARPQWVWEIYNLDPPLEQVSRELAEALESTKRAYQFMGRHLAQAFSWLSKDGALLMLMCIRGLHEEQRQLNGTWGSDQARINSLYGTTLTIDLTQPTSTAALAISASGPDTSDIPEEYLFKVFEAHESWVSRSRRYDESVSALSEASVAASIPPFNPSDAPEPKNNETAVRLLKCIGIVANQHEDDDDVEDEYKKFQDLEFLSQQLGKVHELLPDIKDRIRQVCHANKVDWGQDKERVDRICDMLPFLNEIAIPRLNEIRRRVERGAMLLRVTRDRQTSLREKIDETTDWINGTSYLFIPAIHDLIQDWNNTYLWIQNEYDSFQETIFHRDFEFSNRREKEAVSGYGTDWEKIIWSRWGIRDQRQDPEVSEAFCWKRRAADSNKKATGWFEVRWWTRDKSGEEDSEARSWCGDASRRHG
ncbi:hypothetical protein BHE90_008314 [Fusarium euwallaceae]|uniref:Uncharacterized protein n=1 Tax=Fusarium euwallaceae TaxID=1147111 RepID=A0A430LN86_9HYPO|nr:hypothetical protein BHE90_008314 [Fusarium euwallaceae]